MGASCIHPSQIPLLNQAFSPTEAEMAFAARVVAESAVAELAGRGAFSIDGKMIDPPIVARAQALLDRQAAIEARSPP
jgi:citrate lyase subunit beta/citryl-CoA lyase